MMSGIGRVYVSSTFRDLEQERAVVLEAIERAGGKPAAMEYYGADARPALETCVADVRRSDLYVGILGWRQGYCPPDTPGVGITESEYEAARRLPRLVYLTPEHEDWTQLGRESDADTRAIAAFRERVKREVTAYPFADRTKLALAVASDLSRHLKATTPSSIPDDSLLPYLCDRVDQRNGIIDLLKTEAGVPPVCLVHGARDQGLSRFLDSVREVQLAEWVSSKYPAKECRLNWSFDPPEKVPIRIRKGLALALGLDARAVTDQTLGDRLAALPGPVIVTVQVPTDDWSAAHQARVAAFVRYWQAFPKHTPPKPDVVLLWAEYPKVQPSPLRVLGIASKSERKYQQAVDGVLGLGSEGCVVLPPAGSVPETDVNDWARLEEVRRAAAGRDLDQAVSLLYQSREKIPMEELARELLQLLQRSGDTRASPGENGR